MHCTICYLRLGGSDCSLIYVKINVKRKLSSDVPVHMAIYRHINADRDSFWSYIAEISCSSFFKDRVANFRRFQIITLFRTKCTSTYWIYNVSLRKLYWAPFCKERGSKSSDAFRNGLHVEIPRNVKRKRSRSNEVEVKVENKEILLMWVLDNRNHDSQ